MTTAIDRRNGVVKGSLADVTRQNHTHLAASFVNAECVILVDTSGSMGAKDAIGGRSRFDQACDELAKLQSVLPGKLAVLSFSSSVTFCPTGTPDFIGGSTDLAGALDYAKVADVGDMQFIVISDGEPNNPITALAAARKYTGKIDTVFVGPEGGSGRDFLDKLAKASGGQAVKAHQATALADKLHRLLLESK